MATVGCNSFDIKRDPKCQSYELKEKKKDAKFEAIVYYAANATGYPGFPISPDRLAKELKTPGCGKRLKKLQVTMETKEAGL